MHTNSPRYSPTSTRDISTTMSSSHAVVSVLDSENATLSDSRVTSTIPHRTTIARRKKSQIRPPKHYRSKWSLLSKAQEERLLRHIDGLTKKGFPPNHHQFPVWVANISGKVPGKDWSYKFVLNHYWLVNNYFQLVKEKMEKHYFAPENTYNMDEKGFPIGKVNKTRRTFSHYWKKQGKLQGAAQDGNRIWITLLACVCANGSSLPQALIHPAKSGNVQDSWLDGCYFASSPTGWTNNELGMGWLSHIFDRHTKLKARQGRDPRLLLIDGHGSHLNLDFIYWCEKRNISICAYPPHSTHRLQPLDMSLFSPLSTYYSQALDQWIHETREAFAA